MFINCKCSSVYDEVLLWQLSTMSREVCAQVNLANFSQKPYTWRTPVFNMTTLVSFICADISLNHSLILSLVLKFSKLFKF